MSAGQAATPLLHAVPERQPADCCWEHFRTVGSPRQLTDCLDRLSQHGWQVLSTPEPGPFDSWTVRVRHPRRCLHVA